MTPRLLEVVEKVPAVSARVKDGKSVRRAVRVGIHTGLVVVGEVGASDRREQLVLGDTPNIAARLQALAPPDSGIISDATWRLVQGYFVCHHLGAHVLKGVTAALPLYQVLDESGAQSRLDIVSASLTPLVGREAEMTLLLERWAQTKDGRGQVVVLRGEAGIGKSRLLQAFKQRLASESYVSWQGRCSPYHQYSALSPIIELLRHILRWHPGDTPDDKREKLEQGLRQSRLPLAPQRQKQKTMETIVGLLLELAEQQPGLVIVEDLHWVDYSKLECLTLLIEQVPTARLLVLMTCRPEFQLPWRSHEGQDNHCESRAIPRSPQANRRMRRSSPQRTQIFSSPRSPTTARAPRPR